MKSKVENLLKLAAIYAGDGAFLTAIKKATEAIELMKSCQGIGTTPAEISKHHRGRNCECPYCVEPTLRDTGFDDPPSLR